MDTNLVRYSRAGDKFHYRWAARRCLRMIDPLSLVQCITIEGSKESRAAGEYLIDVAEYSAKQGHNESVSYYQLKHSTKRTRTPFTFSEVSPTLKGFAARFAAQKTNGRRPSTRIEAFCFVSNRSVNRRLKSEIEKIKQGGTPAHKFMSDLERVTKLKGQRLRAFCSLLRFLDAEGDYVVQKQQLRGEVAQFIAGFVDSRESSSLVELVEDRALPKSEDGQVKGRICREDVWQRLGVNSERDLFPAPRVVEPLPHVLRREQHDAILSAVRDGSSPLLIHAEGGVGKSVVARQIAESFSDGSVGLLYDCFGAGKYRNEAEPRHRPGDALIQIANELAAMGLCRPLIGGPLTPRDALFRDFLKRISAACVSLREIQKNARLILLIDAADNAEMAAQENNDHCFASALLRQPLPAGCRLVAFSRTERMHMLKPQSAVRRFELKPFSETETATHLRGWFPNASDDDAREFHRLSSSNPRVQANALAGRYKDLPELLSELGPTRITVDAQIGHQLDAAINRIRDQHTKFESEQAEAICSGLANLPPYIPLKVLAAAAGVDVAAIRSFISEFGRPLWQSDESVQFRDEPTETWFRNRFGAASSLIEKYAGLLEPLADEFSYAAKALPKLWLRAGNYERLIELALSDEHLPTTSPMDARDIRVYRLQFAFKAALKAGRLADATRLAFRAGEEMAGNQRQLDLLTRNVDLMGVLQDRQRIQECAYKRLLEGAWQGSENVYSAALLSAVKDFHGEARNFLRASQRWLQLYFDHREKMREKEPHFHDELTTGDIVELAWAHLQLFGPARVTKFILKWKPPRVIFEVTCKLVERLIDANRFEEISEVARRGARSIHLIIAISSELLAVARFPPRQSLRRTFDSLSSSRRRMPKPAWSAEHDPSLPAIISFLEAAAHHRLSRTKICKILDYYVPATDLTNLESEYRRPERRTFFRATALRAVVSKRGEPAAKDLLPDEEVTTPGARQRVAETRNQLTQIIGALLPWYFARATCITARHPSIDFADITKRSDAALSGRYLRYDPIPYEIPRVHVETLALNRQTPATDVENFIRRVTKGSDPKISLIDRIAALRICYRNCHIRRFARDLEESCADIVAAGSAESPEERSASYIELARAVLPVSFEDASAYFDNAIEAVSKFGDEMVDRWEALIAVARKATDQGPVTSEMAYRFVRCAEMIGDTVGREKYWDRDDVFRVALRLDPNGAFAALSRWRDRDVGWFNRQIEALANYAVESRVIEPGSGWALSGFRGCNASIMLLRTCVLREPDQQVRQYMFDTAVRDIDLDRGFLEALPDLASLAADAGLEKLSLDRATPPLAPEVPQVVRRVYQAQEQPDNRIGKLLRGINVVTADGIATALLQFRELEFPKRPDRFWSELIDQVPGGQEARFLRAVVTVEAVDYYDIRNILGSVRDRWQKKAGAAKEWPTFLTAVGKRFSIEFSERHSFRFLSAQSPMTPDELELMRSGMIEALADTPDMVSAATFFGFISTTSGRITPAEATATLDFALSRFENHIESDFGDGLWDEWLQPPQSIVDSFTGLIWSALGAPHSWIRWEAAHCIRRLAALGCQSEIDSLIQWMKSGVVGAFGCRRYPFYRLHAQLYLLIALARVTVDNADLLASHSDLFVQIALEGIPHLLIQEFAAKIALAIERHRPGTYTSDLVGALRKVGKSQLPARMVSGYTDISTPRSSMVGQRNDGKLYFAWDFDRYWFEPLGRVFGLSETEVERLAQDAAIRIVGVAKNEEHPHDSRQNQWRSLDYTSPNTSHDHGSYPQIDDYQFYYSYHALLSAGAELVETVPVVKHTDREYEDERWEDWFQRHQLTRSDGKWLADRRDPSPHRRRGWVFNHIRENWLWDVTADDFYDIIAHYNPFSPSLCVNGYWSDCCDGDVEDVRVTSAFVDRDMVESLATALRLTPNVYQAEMPVYGETEDFHLPPFSAQGWIKVNGGSDPRLDYLDRYAKQISYPSNEIGATFATLLKLSPDYERRNWYEANAETPSVVSEIWSERTESRRDTSFRHGKRMVASTALLRKACGLLRLELVFCVKIRRDRERSYRREQDDFGYMESSHKILVFSADGILRDATKDYQVG